MTRIDRLGEAMQVMKGLWADGPFSFSGTHYQVAEVDGVPKPHSRIPIMIGGGGPKILALAAREADIVGINPKIVARSINPAVDGDHRSRGRRREDRRGACRRRRQVRRARAAGADLQDGRDGSPEGRGRTTRARFGLPPEVLLTAPFFQIGTIDQITENIQAMRERWGISYILFQSDGVVPAGPVVARLTGT